MTVPATDPLIASVAQEHRLTLLHADRHFDLIAEKTDLIVESWVKAAIAEKGRGGKRRKPNSV